MNPVVETAVGTYAVDLADETVVDHTAGALPSELMSVYTLDDVGVPLHNAVAADRAGSTIVVVVKRRPPLVVSYDAGRTWRETGGGLPAGRAVAIDPDNPDFIVYGARNRLYLSTDGGRFWRALAPELPAIERVALIS